MKVKSIKMLEKAEGGYVNENRKMEITYQNDTKKKALLKLKGGIFDSTNDEAHPWEKLKRYREAGFYRDIYP